MMRSGILLTALLLGISSPASAKIAAELNPPQPPARVQPVPITATSQPYIAIQRDLASLGYTWEEFFLSGEARAYEWIGEGLEVRPGTNTIPYTTRILVLRPVDAKAFSGNVVVEPLNATRGFDSATDLAGMGESMIRHGDVWVGVTSKPIALEALKRFDPVRYAALSWGNPQPTMLRCANPSILPQFMSGPPNPNGPPRPQFSFRESEDGLIWDIYAQLGLLLKSPGRSTMLPGFRKPRLFSTGASQSGILQRTFMNVFHKRVRTPEGGPVYDGYLAEVGPALMRLSQCSEDVLPEDPRTRTPAIDAAVFNLYSEGEMWLGHRTRQPDVIRARTGHVTYEIAGAAHGGGLPSIASAAPISLPPVTAAQMTAALAAAGRRAGPATPGTAKPNQFPRGYLTAAALRNLEDWVNLGRRPPPGGRIVMRGSEVARDADGNALGGVRSVWIDVPTASYLGGIGNTGATATAGLMTPFTPERLKALYPTGRDYAEKVAASVHKSVLDRWILPEEAEAALDSAVKAYPE